VRQAAADYVPESPPASPMPNPDSPGAMDIDNSAPSNEDLEEQQWILNSFQETSSTSNAAQAQAPAKPEANTSKSVRFSTSPLGHSILGAPKIRSSNPAVTGIKPRYPMVTTAPARPPRGPPQPPAIVISEPSPSPRQPPCDMSSALNPWDRQYPNKAGALIGCCFCPSLPCIEDVYQTRQRLQLGSTELTSTVEIP